MQKKEENILKLLYFVYKQYYSKKDKFRTHFWLYIVFYFLNRLYPIFVSYVSARIIDEVISIINIGGDIKQVLPLFAWLAVILLIQVIVMNVYNLTDTLLYQWLSYLEDKVVLSKIIDIEPQAYEDNKFVNEKNILSWNLWTVYNSMCTSVEVLGMLLTASVAFVAIAQQNILLGILAIFSTIPDGYITNKYGKKVWNIWNSNSEDKVKYSNYRGPIFETKFESIQELNVFGYGKYLIDRALDINKKFTQKLEKNNIQRQIWFTVSSTYRSAIYLLAMFYSVFLVIEGDVTVGSLTFIISAYQQFAQNFSDFIYNIAFITGNKSILQSFNNIITRENKIKSGNTNLPVSENGISIELKNVSFKYPGSKDWIFKNLNLEVYPDEDIAIVGKNGAGKTTLIKLLLRIYDPDEGEILVNGINLKDLDLKSYYAKVGVLNQMFNRLGITAKDNIQIGDVSKLYKFKEVKKSAVLADVDDTLSKLPKRYNTYLTKDVSDGFQLSGGQWQKVAIARAFYRDSKLLILDEPTSAVDAISEEKIFDNIRTNSINQTTLIVSHRFSTVKKAKRIVVIDEGKIVEQGNHSQLMANKGLYSEMYLKQSAK